MQGSRGVFFTLSIRKETQRSFELEQTFSFWRKNSSRTDPWRLQAGRGRQGSHVGGDSQGCPWAGRDVTTLPRKGHVFDSPRFMAVGLGHVTSDNKTVTQLCPQGEWDVLVAVNTLCPFSTSTRIFSAAREDTGTKSPCPRSLTLHVCVCAPRSAEDGL